MRSTFLAAGAVSSALALVGFAGAAEASATIDLIWADTGTNEIGYLNTPSEITLRVILTAGPNGSQGGEVSVDYSDVIGTLAVVGFMSTPGGPLPIDLSPEIDTGTWIENLDSGSIPPIVGSGLMAGQSHQLGTVTFQKSGLLIGALEIRSGAAAPRDHVLDLAGNDITATTTFNSAFLSNSDPQFCGLEIEIKALRAGSPKVTVGATKNVTAIARIAKGTAVSGTTIDTLLQIAAFDGPAVVDWQQSDSIQLGTGKSGSGDTLALNIDQCNSGSIDFVATFSGNDADGNLCAATRRITKTCK